MAQQPRQRGQFTQTLLIFAVIFLGTRLLFPGDQKPDTRTLVEVKSELQKLNSAEDDVKASATLPAYLQKVAQTKDKEKWAINKVNEAELEGVVLVAQAKLKGALSREGKPEKAYLVHKKLTDGWTLMQTYYQKLRTKEAWAKPVAVTPDPFFESNAVSPSQLYDTLVQKLSEKNKSEMVWGLFPGFPAIDFFVRLTGSQSGFSYWFAAFLLALVVRIIIYPWSMKQYRFGKQMMQIQPYAKELKDKFTDKKTNKVPPDKQAQLSAETMALYKEYGLNPFAGCGSAVLQMPIYMVVLAAMQLYRFEFDKGTFAWIHPGATKFLGLDLAPNLGQPDHLLIIVYGISMIVSQYLMPVSDPTQVRQQRLMGLGVSVFITIGMFTYTLPSAFILYWVFANVLATAQALYVYKVMPSQPLEKVQTVPGGVKPKPGFMEKLQAMMEQQANPSQNGAQENKEKPKDDHVENRIDPALFGKAGSGRARKKR
jgi:YidC/Oxa1 family membrane protein insertase